jgi:hypothetical protein
MGVFGFWGMLVRLGKGGGKLTSNFAEFSAEEDLCLDVFVFDLHLVKVLQDDVVASFMFDCWGRRRKTGLRRRVECKACWL